jgi:hypothetical protein
MLGLTVFVDPVNITDELSKLPLISPVNLSSQQMHALWHLTIDMGMMTRLCQIVHKFACHSSALLFYFLGMGVLVQFSHSSLKMTMRTNPN